MRKDVRFLPEGVVVDFLGVAFLLFIVCEDRTLFFYDAEGFDSEV